MSTFYQLNQAINPNNIIGGYLIWLMTPSKNNKSSGYAVFLPAISNFYVRKISQHYAGVTDMFPPERKKKALKMV